MKTNTSELLHRFDDFFGTNWDKLKEAGSNLSDTVRKQASEWGNKAGERLEESKKAIITAEEYVADSVRKHPGLYIGIAVGIAATVAAGIIISRVSRRR